MSRLRLLSGPDPGLGAEKLTDHMQRFGRVPVAGPGLVDQLELSGLTGRGGASFPAARKWRAVAGKGAVVIVNGTEGEPQSHKDRVLMASRPHLVLDGALLAARAVHASRVVVYIGEQHHVSRAAMVAAMAERPEKELRQATLVLAPARYVAGESSAVANFVFERVASPTSRPPSPHEGGDRRPPALVQNVETLAQVALLARYGAEWFRTAGTRGAAGTILVTVTGAVAQPGVIEVEAGTTVGEVLAIAGGATRKLRAVLLGGYFGAWVDGESAMELPLEGAALKERGLTLGCGVLGLLPADGCGVCETAGIMAYLASESSAQCGPCFFGLRALAGATGNIARGGSTGTNLERLHRWSREVAGRGACHHPDGASLLLRSALSTFASDFANHRPHLRSRVA